MLDASECPPTFGTSPEMVSGIIAGGMDALYQSIENAEDDPIQGWKDLQQHQPDQNDFVIGIAASGTTPYVVGALEQCQQNGITTGCVTCNPKSPNYTTFQLSHRSRRRARICNRKLPNESRNCPKTHSQYDHHFDYDSIGKGQREQND